MADHMDGGGKIPVFFRELFSLLLKIKLFVVVVISKTDFITITDIFLCFYSSSLRVEINCSTVPKNITLQRNKDTMIIFINESAIHILT